MGVGQTRVAVVGAGGMAREHVRAFAAVPGVRVAGIHSRTRSKAQSLAAELDAGVVCESVSDLYQRTRADLVVMAVPELSANSVAKVCFEHPWTVFMEKPPGLNLEDAQDIHAAARKRKRRVLVGLNRRFLSSTRTALEDLQGRPSPRFIHVQDQQNQAASAAGGQPQPVVDHWMYANSIHLVDYLLAFGRGEVTSVRQVFPWSPGARIALAAVEFDSGDCGIYEVVWNGPGPWAVSVTTDQRRWELRPLEQAAYQSAGERNRHPVEQIPWDRDFKPGFRLQAEHVVRAAHGDFSLAPTLDDAMKTMRLIREIFGL